MIVQCPACSARYRIRDANIPPSGGKIRCPSCGHSFVVYPEPEEPTEDSTSITSQNAIKELVNNMASPGGDGGDVKTEIVQGSDLDKIRQMQNFQQDTGEPAEDGTVEIKNPMEFWERLQVERAKGTVPAPAPAVQDSDSDEDEEAATEIVSADSIKLPFGVGGGAPSIPPPANVTPSIPPPSSSSGLPTPAFPGARPATPPLPSIPKPPLPSLRQQAPPLPIAAPAIPSTTPDMAAVPDHLNSPTMGRPTIPSDQPLRPPTAADAPAPFEPPSAPAFGFPGTSSDDIMAAIEEVSHAHEVEATGAPEPVPAVDVNHDGPWKLKTNFGLTYEFPDTKSLNGWLGSRDELDGYMVAADESTFVSLDSFPQLKTGPSNPASQSIASSGLFPQPATLPTAPDSGTSQPFNAPTFTPPSASGAFQAMPQQPASTGSTERQKVTNEYRPPSGKGNGILWLVLLVLVLVGAGIFVQTFEIFDIKGLVTGTPSTPQTPKMKPNGPKKTNPTPSEVEPEDDTADIDRVLKDARRDVKNNKMQRALERLQTVQMLAPDNLEMHEMLVKIYGALGQEQKATASAERVEELKAKALEASAESDAGTPDAGKEAGDDKDAVPANPN